MTIKNIIFDLDDTLINCGAYYRTQQDKLAQYQHERTNLPIEFINKLRSDIDVNFTQTPGGFNRERFPRSFAATSMVLDIMLGNVVDEPAAYQSFELGDQVFEATYPIFNGVPGMLTTYMNAGYNLFLLTKGDFTVQTRKIEMNDLSNWFHRDRMYIVPHKNPETLQRVLTDHALEVSQTVIIGDSIRDDIDVAYKVGCEAIWVYGRHNAGVYEHMKIDIQHQIDEAAHLPLMLDPQTGTIVVKSLRVTS